MYIYTQTKIIREKIATSKFQTTLPHVNTQKKSPRHTLAHTQRKNKLLLKAKLTPTHIQQQKHIKYQ